MEIGDKVTWTHCSRRGSFGFNLSTRTGKIIAVDSRNVAVKYQGQIFNLRPDRVRTLDQKNELTDLVMTWGKEISQ